MISLLFRYLCGPAFPAVFCAVAAGVGVKARAFAFGFFFLNNECSMTCLWDLNATEASFLSLSISGGTGDDR